MPNDSASRFARYLFHAFKLFGVATMSIDRDFNFAPSKRGIAYNVLLIVLVLISSYFAIDLSYFIDFAARGELEKITDTIQTVFVIFTSLLILVAQCVRQTAMVKMANDARRYVATAATLCRVETYEDKSKLALQSTTTIVLVNVLLTIVWLLTTPAISSQVLLFFVSMTICNFVINALVMQYCVVLIVVGHLFDVLNSSLVEITSFKSHEPMEISFIRKYTLQMKLNRLSRCRSFFTSLALLSKEISQFMETITLACMTNVFLTLIIYGYYAMKPLIVGSNVIATSILIRACGQMCFSIVSTVLLTKASSRAVGQSKRTGEIVNECLYKEGCSCHQDVEKQLNLFSNYLLHANVRFGVCNLFALDESLLMSIAGSITTYLVILLQFKQSDAELPAAPTSD